MNFVSIYTYHRDSCKKYATALEIKFPDDDENLEDVSNEKEHSSEDDDNPFDVEPTIPAKPNLSDVRKVLPPTSSGRRRFLPKRLEN